MQYTNAKTTLTNSLKQAINLKIGFNSTSPEMDDNNLPLNRITVTLTF